MKKLLFPALLLALLVSACGESKKKPAETPEVQQTEQTEVSPELSVIDSVANELKKTSEEIKESAEKLESALKDL